MSRPLDPYAPPTAPLATREVEVEIANAGPPDWPYGLKLGGGMAALQGLVASIILSLWTNAPTSYSGLVVGQAFAFCVCLAVAMALFGRPATATFATKDADGFLARLDLAAARTSHRPCEPAGSARRYEVAALIRPRQSGIIAEVTPDRVIVRGPKGSLKLLAQRLAE